MKRKDFINHDENDKSSNVAKPIDFYLERGLLNSNDVIACGKNWKDVMEKMLSGKWECHNSLVCRVSVNNALVYECPTDIIINQTDAQEMKIWKDFNDSERFLAAIDQFEPDANIALFVCQSVNSPDSTAFANDDVNVVFLGMFVVDVTSSQKLHKVVFNKTSDQYIIK